MARGAAGPGRLRPAGDIGVGVDYVWHGVGDQQRDPRPRGVWAGGDEGVGGNATAHLCGRTAGRHSADWRGAGGVQGLGKLQLRCRRIFDGRQRDAEDGAGRADGFAAEERRGECAAGRSRAAPGSDYRRDYAEVWQRAGRSGTAGDGPFAEVEAEGGGGGDEEGGGLAARAVAGVLRGLRPDTPARWADMDVGRAVQRTDGCVGVAGRSQVQRRDAGYGQDVQLGVEQNGGGREPAQPGADLSGAVSDGQEARGAGSDAGHLRRDTGEAAGGTGDGAKDRVVVVRRSVHGAAGVDPAVRGDRRQEVHRISGRGVGEDIAAVV